MKTAPAVPQKATDQAWAGSDEALVYLDAILLMARNPETHDNRLLGVLRRLEKWGLRLRLEKCNFALPNGKCLGVIVSERGIETNPQHVSAFQAIQAPTPKKENRSLYGLINHYGKFVDHLHTYRVRPGKLLAKDEPFGFPRTSGEPC